MTRNEALREVARRSFTRTRTPIGLLLVGVGLLFWAGDVGAGAQVEPRIKNPRSAKTLRPTLGDPKAPVTFMVFAGYQCPYSQRLMVELRQLVKEQPGRLNVVWRDFPLAFHKHGRSAALAAQEVFFQLGNKAFWDFNALILANVRSIDDAQLALWATQVGADAVKVRSALTQARGRAQAAVDLDLREGAAVNVRAIPTSFIFRQGTPLSQAKILSGFRQRADLLTALATL